MPAEVLATDTPALFAAAVEKAAMALRAGQVVALPTETVYGLAANALDPRAVARIFTIKGRPPQNPIIVHVVGLQMAQRCVSAWPNLADQLMAAFWPGPLTLILPRTEAIPDIVTGSGPTVGVRWPNHPFIQAVIRACDFPLAAPSANLSGEISPTTAEHVRKSLGTKVPLIVDGGPCHVGIESTVLDVSVSPACILRPGMIHAESLLAVAGALASGQGYEGEVLRSPGQLAKHYAPKARLVVWSWSNDGHLVRQISDFAFQNNQVHILAHTRIPAWEVCGCISMIPHDPVAFARAIYAELHRCDEAGARLIIIEAPPDGPEWDAIRDRLARASASDPAATD